MTGRPSDYTEELADMICGRIAEGRSLKSICDDEDMPHTSTVFRWLAKHEAFRDSYARAREAQADVLFDDILDIADDSRNDWMERRDDRGGESYLLNGDHVQRAKLRIDARKWMAAKLQPKKYGEKLELGGNVGLTVTLESDADKL